MENTLIVKADFATYKLHIPSTVGVTERLDACIIEAQRNNIRPVLGESLYYTLANTPSVAPYTELLGGGTYDNSDGVTVHFVGLKAALCYYAYADFYAWHGVNLTPFGIGIKKNEDTEQISDKEKAQRITDLLMKARIHLDDAVKYLNAKKEDFPLWKCASSEMPSGHISISAVSPYKKSKKINGY